MALFVTCLTENFFPRVGQATVLLLEHLGCRVEFPVAQTCCGQPWFNSGDHESARRLALHMTQVFEKFPRVVTPSGSCAAMVKEHFPSLFQKGSAEHRKVAALGEKTTELTRFLADFPGFDASRGHWEGVTTYHYSCHLRGLASPDDAPAILRQIHGVKHQTLPNMEQCCGFGGAFATRFPEVSVALGRDKLGCAEETGAQTLVCNDAGCGLHLVGLRAREGFAVRLKHIAEILAESLGLLPREDGR